MDTQAAVVLPLEVAELIDRVYLPANPAKLRTAAPETRRAVAEFKQRLEDGRRRKLTSVR